MDDIFGVQVLDAFDDFVDKSIDELRIESLFIPLDDVE